MAASKNIKIFGNSKVGKGGLIEDFVLIGCPSKDELKSGIIAGAKIGENCTIRAHSIIYSNVEIGDGFFCGHNVLIREKTKIGRNVVVGSGTIIDGYAEIGDDVSIQSAVYITINSKIEDRVFIGPRAVFTNDKYMERGAKLTGPTIREGARIGANSVILPGVEVGRNAVVGAGSVVTKNVRPNSTVVGNPAREMAKKGAKL